MDYKTKYLKYKKKYLELVGGKIAYIKEGSNNTILKEKSVGFDKTPTVLNDLQITVLENTIRNLEDRDIDDFTLTKQILKSGIIIGAGANGFVYIITNPITSKKYAIKFIYNCDRKKEQTEISPVSKLISQPREEVNNFYYYSVDEDNYCITISDALDGDWTEFKNIFLTLSPIEKIKEIANMISNLVLPIYNTTYLIYINTDIKPDNIGYKKIEDKYIHKILDIGSTNELFEYSDKEVTQTLHTEQYVVLYKSILQEEALISINYYLFTILISIFEVVNNNNILNLFVYNPDFKNVVNHIKTNSTPNVIFAILIIYALSTLDIINLVDDAIAINITDEVITEVSYLINLISIIAHYHIDYRIISFFNPSTRSIDDVDYITSKDRFHNIFKQQYSNEIIAEIITNSRLPKSVILSLFNASKKYKVVSPSSSSSTTLISKTDEINNLLMENENYLINLPVSK